MSYYRLIGEIAIRTDFAKDEIIRHTEVVEADAPASREALIDESLNGFEEEQYPCWCEGYPLILPEPEQQGIAGEVELRGKVLLEALPYLLAAQANRFGCESIEYVTAVVATELTNKNIRATTREVKTFLADAGYPTHIY